MSTSYYFVDTQAKKATKLLEEHLEGLQAADLLFPPSLPKVEDLIQQSSNLHIGNSAFNELLLKRQDAFYTTIPEMKSFWEANQPRLLIVSENGIRYTWGEFEEEVLLDCKPARGNHIEIVDGYAWSRINFS